MEFLVLQCPACQRAVKIRSHSAGVRVGCPYCQQPIEAPQPDLGEISEPDPGEEPAGREAVEIPPLAFRQIEEADLAEGSSDGPKREYADEYRRRRYPFETPEWDDETREADGNSMEPQRNDDSPDSPGTDLATPAGVQPEPAGRNRLRTRREQDFRSITFIIMAAAIVTATLVVYSAVVRTLEVARQDDKTLRERPEEVQKKIAGVIAQDDPISIFMTSAEEEAAVAIVYGFLNAKSLEDRLPFVRDPERVEPLMRDWYARADTVTEWPEGEVLLRDKRLDQGRYFIRLALEFAGIGNRIFVVEQTQEDLKLDWETAVGYQPTPLAEYKAKRPTTPVEFRVKLKPSEYYNFEFDDRELYFAVELSYPGRGEFNLIGYINRTRDWAPALIGRLEDGEAPSMIVKLQYPSDTPRDDNQVEIIAIVSQSWWL